MHLEEKFIGKKEIFQGRIFSVSSDDVELENGNKAIREVVHHNGGVCIIPITDNGGVLMVKQFRYPYAEAILEVPAGKLEKGEDHAECGRRELLEETGCTCKEYEYLGKLYPTPAYVDEIIHMYLAKIGRAHV